MYVNVTLLFLAFGSLIDPGIQVNTTKDTIDLALVILGVTKVVPLAKVAYDYAGRKAIEYIAAREVAKVFAAGAVAQGVTKIPEIANKGNSIGRIIANSLNEQIAMKQVMSNPLVGAEKFPFSMGDSRWASVDGWVKMQNIVTLSDGRKVNIHFVYNELLNLVDDFKFK